MFRKHFKDNLDYYSKEYTTDSNGNKKSSYQLNRVITGYLNINNANYVNLDDKLIGKEFEFTCDIEEDIKTGNYLFDGNKRYTIKSVQKSRGITFSFTRVNLECINDKDNAEID